MLCQEQKILTLLCTEKKVINDETNIKCSHTFLYRINRSVQNGVTPFKNIATQLFIGNKKFISENRCIIYLNKTWYNTHVNTHQIEQV